MKRLSRTKSEHFAHPPWSPRARSFVTLLSLLRHPGILRSKISGVHSSGSAARSDLRVRAFAGMTGWKGRPLPHPAHLRMQGPIALRVLVGIKISPRGADTSVGEHG